MPVPAHTAEWTCTRCGTTNRRLAAREVRELRDRCLHCGTWHRVTPSVRPVRWEARAAP